MKHDNQEYDFWNHKLVTNLCRGVNSENQVRGCIFDGQICTLAYRKELIFVQDLIVMSVANVRMVNV